MCPLVICIGVQFLRLIGLFGFFGLFGLFGVVYCVVLFSGSSVWCGGLLVCGVVWFGEALCGVVFLFVWW